MGHKIFISYKYHDNNVYPVIDSYLTNERIKGKLTPRDYVDVLATYISDHSPHYCKAEEDNNDLSRLGEDEIWKILKDKMFYSTMTIVLVSPNMKEPNKRDIEQWIPWEIKYSLSLKQRKTSSGNTIRSYTNAMLAIVLPDKNNSYKYYFEDKTCCPEGCQVNKSGSLFYILRKNTFNRIKDTNARKCPAGDTIYSGGLESFIPFYKWSEINSKEGIENAIEHAYKILSQKTNYRICQEIEQ